MGSNPSDAKFDHRFSFVDVSRRNDINNNRDVKNQETYLTPTSSDKPDQVLLFCIPSVTFILQLLCKIYIFKIGETKSTIICDYLAGLAIVNLICSQQQFLTFLFKINLTEYKRYRPHGAVSTTAWGCPQDKGPPHDNLTINLIFFMFTNMFFMFIFGIVT